MSAVVLIAALLWPWSTSAQDNQSRPALEATQLLELTSVVLTLADSARDRTRALTKTNQIYEAGSSAMRDGLRRNALHKSQRVVQPQAREQDIAQLPGVLHTIETATASVPVLHPPGSLGVARDGMMLFEVVPGLDVQIQMPATDLREVQTLRHLPQCEADTLTGGLTWVQDARTQKSEATVGRPNLPRRFFEDPVRTTLPISSTETLQGFASGISVSAEGEINKSNAAVTYLKDRIAPSTQDVILDQSGEADTAGVFRPALVLDSPTTATILYRSPSLDLENMPDLFFVSSGLQEIYDQTEDVNADGTPVALMPGETSIIGATLVNKR